MAKQQNNKTQTLRQKAKATTAKADKAPRKLTKASATARTKLGYVRSTAKREYYLPMPDNRVGRFLNRRRRFIPKYFRESWAELQQVTWPTRRETLKLTSAVFIFTIAFGLIITFTDYGLDKLFRKVLLDS